MSSAKTLTQTLNIASGQTTTESFDISQVLLTGLQLGTLTGTTLTILNAKTDGGTYSPVYDDSGAIYTITATDNAYIALDLTKTAGLKNIKLVSGSSEAADRTIDIYYTEAS